jgi:hypothetical protein
MSEETISRIHHDLKIISQLREGDRVYCCDGLMCISRPTIFNAILRWSRGDCRIKSINTIQNTLLDAVTLVEQALSRETSRRGDISPSRIKDSTLLTMIKRFYVEIQQALIGLRYLLSTYSDDTSARTKIQVIREKITDRLTAIEKQIMPNKRSSSPHTVSIVDLDEEEFEFFSCALVTYD